MPKIQIADLFGGQTVRQTVSVGYGKANLSNTLATYASMAVSAPFVRVSAVTSGQRVGKGNAARVGEHDMNGVVITQQVQHPNGTVILLTASWKRGGASIRDGALFVRLRHGAPTYNVVAKVPTGQDNICGDSFTLFSGSADIMNADELALLGIQVNRSYVSRFMDDEELEECFQIVQLARETVARPSLTAISTPDGVQYREVAQLPSRRLVLRRGG